MTLVYKKVVLLLTLFLTLFLLILRKDLLTFYHCFDAFNID